MLFTFQSALPALQQPHKHSYSLQLACHTQIAQHYLHYTLAVSAFSFLSRGFL